VGPILSTASFPLPTEPLPTEGPMAWVRVQGIRKANSCRPFFFLLIVFCAACGEEEISLKVASMQDGVPLRSQQILAVTHVDEKIPGRAEAIRYCQTCHIFAEPDLLDKGTLRNFILPFLAERLGVPAGTADLPQNPIAKQHDPKALEVLTKAGVYSKYPLLPLDAWPKIVAYYLHAAPEEALPQAKKDRVRQSLPQFEVFKPDYRTPMPFTTLVAIDAQKGWIYTGDSAENSLAVLDGNGKVLQKIASIPSPVAIDLRTEEAWITSIGSVFPSDNPQGKLLVLKKDQGKLTVPPQEILTGLARPTFTGYADLNDDGLEDIVMSGFGYMVGHFSWLEQIAKGQYREHMLNKEPGAISSAVHDFNRDGLPDIAVLMGQAREGVFIYYNLGGGKFAESYEIQWPPSYGAAHMSLVDFNGDGAMDFITANGDNADYTPFAKRYHGVRIYINDGENRFDEAFFYPLNGAYKALPVDFDGDGDLDIAAICFFPDYEKAPEESFVYLENSGEMGFIAHSFPEAIDARWLTMDAGDIDGDGDEDLVLGAFVRGASNVPPELEKRWQQATSLLILRNKRF